MKKIYEQPETVVTRVELESPICAGSPDITAESPNGVTIKSQDISTGFGTDNSYGESVSGAPDSWD